MKKITGLFNGADLITKGLDQKTMLKHCESICVVIGDGRHRSAPQLSIPGEATARTAKLLAAILAVQPIGCGGFEMVAGPTPRQTTQQSAPLYADPFVIFLVLLFILQAAMFMRL